MAISSISTPAPIVPLQSITPKTPEPVPAPDKNATGAADGTRLPQPTVLPPLPPGQGTRIDQLV